MIQGILGWLTGGGQSKSERLNEQIDGSIWYIVDEYGDPWLNTKTRLSKLLFVVQQETKYAQHLDFRKSWQVQGRDLGPIVQNLDDYCQHYVDHDAMRVREQTTFGGNTRYKYQATGHEDVADQISEPKQVAIDSALGDYHDLPVSNLVQEIIDDYPEYSHSVNEW